MTHRFALLIAGTICCTSLMASESPDIDVFFGTERNSKSENPSRGIYHSTLNTQTGHLTPPTLAAEVDSPGFLALHPNGRFLYSVNSGEYNGQRAGGVTAFKITPAGLEFLNSEPVGSAGPCHLVVEPTGCALFTANYSGGTVAAFPIRPDGSLGPRSDLHKHEGSGPNADRQEKAHAHGVTIAPGGRLLLVPDLGTDEVRIYEIHAETATLSPAAPPALATEPGAGPRHITFSPCDRHAYLINELNNTLGAYAWSHGGATLLHNLQTLPADFTAYSKAAEVEVSPDGLHVYASNRGCDTIAIFGRDPQTGRLTPKGHAPMAGSEPRSFAISPCGSWLIAGNQYIHSVSLFRVDKSTGALTPVGEPLPCPGPICILFSPQP